MTAVGIAALAVSIVSVMVAVVAVLYARKLDEKAAKAVAAAERSASTGELAHALEQQRRHAELTPHFQVTFEPVGESRARLTVFLAGPPILERLDALTVTVRDDKPWRDRLWSSSLPVETQVWGPYRFVPGVGPEPTVAFSGPGKVADEAGRTMPTSGVSVGEKLRFFLEPTDPPVWLEPDMPWQVECGTVLRLRLECHRRGWEPWTLVCEMETVNGPGIVEVP